jgi:ribose 5-phosphate isomerase A
MANDLQRNDQEKEAAARASLQFVKDGQVVGLGTGSTAAFFIKLLAERVKGGLRVRGIPTSVKSQELAERMGIPLTTLDECQEIDVTVDGADEVDPQLRLIKGGGGAMLREKIVASATKQMIVVADASKQVEVLGRFPLPVEVIRFAEALIKKRITELGAEVSVRQGADGKPYVTDENHHILDCRFGQIRDADGLARRLSDMPGVVEHGLFIGMAKVALFARGSEIVELRSGNRG